MHGVSFINDFITNSNKINENFKISILNINFDNTHGSINKLSIKKIFNFCKIMFKPFSTLSKKDINYIYFSLTPTGLGFIRDLFL